MSRLMPSLSSSLVAEEIAVFLYQWFLAQLVQIDLSAAEAAVLTLLTEPA